MSISIPNSNVSLSNLCVVTGTNVNPPFSSSNLYATSNLSLAPQRNVPISMGFFRGLQSAAIVTPASGVAKSIPYPPSAINSATSSSNLSGVTYTFTGQGIFDSKGAWIYDKDQSTTSYFDTMGGYNATTGVYQGTAAATNGITGAWTQMQTSTPILINAYDFTPLGSKLFKKWYLFGSTDGTTWTQLDMRDLASWTYGQTPRRFTFSNTASYSYFRFVINLAEGNTAPALQELAYVYQESGTDAIIDLEAKDLSATAVSAWGPFTQTTASQQPDWNASGGHFGTTYVYFNKTNIDYMSIPGTLNIPVATNGGLTFACMYNITDLSSPSTDWVRIFQTYYGTTSTEAFVASRWGPYNDMLFQLRNSSGLELLTNNSLRIVTGAWNTGWRVIIFRYRTSDRNVSVWTSSNLASPTLTRFANGSDTAGAVHTDISVGAGKTFLCAYSVNHQTPFMQLGGVLMFSRAVSDTEATDIYNYFRSGGATIRAG